MHSCTQSVDVVLVRSFVRSLTDDQMQSLTYSHAMHKRGEKKKKIAAEATFITWTTSGVTSLAHPSAHPPARASIVTIEREEGRPSHQQ